MSKKIVIIGGVAAGPKAAARARRCDPKAEITLIEQGDFLSYAGCGMPFYIGGMVKEHQELMSTPVGIVRDANFFKNVKDIDILSRTRAVKIDREKKEVHLVNLNTSEKSCIPYDKLVLATGSTPFLPPIPGIDLQQVFVLGSLNDAVAIRTAAAEGARKIAIMGGGLIGLELAESLKSSEYDVEVYVIEMQEHVLPGMLDPEMALLVEKHLIAKDINLLTSEKVLSLEGNNEGRVQRLVTENTSIDVDMVVISTGVRPNVELARAAGLKLGQTGAIAVNEYMQTSDPDIYAGGDCVEGINLITGKPIYTPMGSVANRHGRIIGSNLAGGRETIPAMPGTAIVKLFAMNAGSTGLTESRASHMGYEVISFICPGPDRAHFYPGNNPIIIKLVADKKTRKLIGAQIVGPGDVNKRLDVAVMAISMGATVDQLANFDLAYAPPFATALDAMTHAANSLRNKLDGLAKSVGPLEVKEKLDRQEEFILLDTRTPKEYQEVRLPYPNVIHIPLGQLRKRSSELPKDKEIILFCKVSMRGYEGQLLLENEGFNNVKFFEGGIAVWPFEVDTTKI
ncbi:FAD-dependent oxidoreductase [Desulfolucanica intricata]|uniref:FAD-dependent oxidoreductase n=1 Tax=Desulfolucanica intricata TaxID=1285191 RepID=UPI00082F7322|nr:FAD-dependent oxidoreductase [Desulfolucanica intricata]